MSVAEALPESPTSLTRTVPQPPTPLRVWLLACLVGTLWVGYLRWSAGAEAEFSLYGVPSLGWYGLAALLITLTLSTLTRPRIGLRWSSVLVLSLVPAAMLTELVLDSPTLTLDPTQIYTGALLCTGLFLLFRTQSLCGRPQWRAVCSALLVVCTFLGLNQVLYIDARLWYPRSADDSASVTRYDATELESLLFGQAAKIDAAVTQLGPRQGSSNAYFLGFAGYAEEKVFAEEIKFAASVMHERYGSGERSLLLLNDARDLETQPLASVNALVHGIDGIAGQMNREDDVLILALSSHGSKTAKLSVSNHELPLGRLSASQLRTALDNAGIRWRLIVVSACYSGSFIEPLANEDTAVITAAAPDRTSFGCSNERNLTYFGEAFYRDSLVAAQSLRAAFDQALTLVTERELANGIKPSYPVAHFGRNIEAKLSELAGNSRQK